MEHRYAALAFIHTTVMDRLLMTDEDYRPPLGEKDHFRKGEIPARTDATLGKGHQELAKMYSLGSPLYRLGIRNKKGWLGRNFHAVDNVRRGPNNILWCINTHNAAYHTRQLQISDKYRKAIFTLRKPNEDMPKSIDTNDSALKQCPLCADQPNLSSTPAGTARHIHCLCTNQELSTARNLSYNAIEHEVRAQRHVNNQYRRRRIPPDQINIGEAIGLSPLTDPTSEFSQQSEDKSTTSLTTQSRSTTTASSAASTKAKRRRKRKQIKKSKKPKHAKPTARR